VTGRAINSAFDGYRAQRARRWRFIPRRSLRLFVTAGGLICYGLDPNDPRRPAAGDVDRILKAEKLADCRCRRRPGSNWSSPARRPSGPICRQRYWADEEKRRLRRPSKHSSICLRTRHGADAGEPPTGPISAASLSVLAPRRWGCCLPRYLTGLPQWSKWAAGAPYRTT
jgi:hypothetical protein